MPYVPTATSWKCNIRPAHTHATRVLAVQCIRRHEVSAPYGFCPLCYGRGERRDRANPGQDICTKGHRYASDDALKLEELEQDPPTVLRIRAAHD